MNPDTYQWLWPVFFYFVGSIPVGYLLGKSRGIDIRQHGSGNIGATNVWRVMGRNYGLVAFICDFLKGFLPLFLVKTYFLPEAASWSIQLLLVACGIASILGHNYTPWLGFKGGKGIATSAGMLGALMPWVLAVALSLWIIAVLITRTVSIGSIIASVVLAPATLWFYWGNWIYLALSVLAGGLAVWRHKANIQRLWDGTESKISFGSRKKDSPEDSP